MIRLYQGETSFLFSFRNTAYNKLPTINRNSRKVYSFQENRFSSSKSDLTILNFDANSQVSMRRGIVLDIKIQLGLSKVLMIIVLTEMDECQIS